MPLYDWECPNCGKETSKLMSYDEYDKADIVECEHCQTPLSKDRRVMGRGLRTTVKGSARKGNYNSRDFS